MHVLIEVFEENRNKGRDRENITIFSIIYSLYSLYHSLFMYLSYSDVLAMKNNATMNDKANSLVTLRARVHSLRYNSSIQLLLTRRLYDCVSFVC